MYLNLYMLVDSTSYDWDIITLLFYANLLPFWIWIYLWSNLDYDQIGYSGELVSDCD